jgi:hypothetical protein
MRYALCAKIQQGAFQGRPFSYQLPVFPFVRLPDWAAAGRAYNAANSAPHRSQYHSVGRLSVPHSPHLSVLA